MGLGAFLKRLDASAAKSRLAYHGYDDETIDRMADFLRSQKAERDARLAHDLAVEERAKQAELDRAAEKAQAAEEKRATQRTARLKSLSDQLDAGVYPDNLLGREDVDPNDLADVIAASNQRAQAKRAEAEMAAGLKKKAGDVEQQEADDRDFARFTRRADYTRKHKEPDPPEPEKDDPDFKRAWARVDRDPANDELTPEQLVEKAKALAAKLKAARTGASPVVTGSSASVAPTASASDPVLDRKLATLDPESRAEFDKIMASGDPAKIARAKQRLMGMQ